MRSLSRGICLLAGIGLLFLACDRQSASTPSPESKRTASVPTITQGGEGNGAVLYARFCAGCHGPGGKGDGPAAAALPVRPADHTDGAIMSKISDGELFKVIKDGGQAAGKSPVMPRWGGTLTDEQIQALVVHVRNLAKAR